MTEEALLTPAQLAERFGITPKKLLELRSKHGWPHVKIGRRIRFTEAQAAQIVEQCSVVGDDQGSQTRAQTRDRSGPRVVGAPSPFGLTDRSAARARAG